MSSDPAAARVEDLPLPLVSVRTEAYCYGPLVERLDPVELASSGGPQRWSEAGAPTVYLASDIGVALAEWGRHVPLDGRRDPSGLWRVPVRLERAVDLRDPEVTGMRALAELAAVDGCPDRDDPAWYLKTDDTRVLGAWLRSAAGLDGLVVPSVAFLDDRSRGNLVVFLEDEAAAPRSLGEPALVAAIRWADGAPARTSLDTRVQVPARPLLGRV